MPHDEPHMIQPGCCFPRHPPDDFLNEVCVALMQVAPGAGTSIFGDVLQLSTYAVLLAECNIEKC